MALSIFQQDSVEEFEIVTNLDGPDSVSLYEVAACLYVCSVVDT